MMGGEFDAQKVVTIGSGLSLSKKLISRMLKIYNSIFDDDFVLYLADIEFYFRLGKLDFVNGFCCGEILHSESIKLSYPEMSETTKLEMGYLNIIRKVRYKKSTLRLILFCIRYKIKSRCSFSSLRQLVKSAIIRRHPRSVFNISANFEPDYSNIKE